MPKGFRTLAQTQASRRLYALGREQAHLNRRKRRLAALTSPLTSEDATQATATHAITKIATPQPQRTSPEELYKFIAQRLLRTRFP